MHFNEYLKLCREHNDLTQEQLVSDLYSHDIDMFESLDTSTLSKWERNIVKPKTSRQVSILKYFQKKSGIALPCLDSHTVNEAEEMISRVGMQNLLGNSKRLVLNFPSFTIGADDLNVYQLRNSESLDKIIEVQINLSKDLRNSTSQLKFEQFKEWALHPSSSFYVCEYKEQFFGLLFTLRLKPEIFEKVMDLEIVEKDLTVDDFASFEEMGCNHTISFIAMSEKVATLLFIRYYAHLIANQKVIAEVGTTTIIEDARKLISNMNLRYHGGKHLGEGLELKTYRETLPNFLASEKVVKMILSKQECPEE